MTFKYKIITVMEPDQTSRDHVVIEHDDGGATSFPVDETNPNYVAFLEANPDASLSF